MPKKIRANISSNLRSVIAAHHSVSAAAEALHVNRQQINKYLNGSSTPSIFVLSKFSKYYGVPIDLLLADPGEFDTKLTEMHRDVPHPGKDYVLEKIERLLSAQEAQADAPDISGNYYLYAASCETCETAKFFVSIRRHDRIYTARTHHNYSNVCPDGRPLVRSSTEILALTDDKIYFLSPPYEEQHQRFSFGIFYRERFDPPRHFVGNLLSTQFDSERRILPVAAVLQFIGRGPITRDLLRPCGVYEFDAPEIPDNYRRMLIRKFQSDRR